MDRHVAVFCAVALALYVSCINEHVTSAEATSKVSAPGPALQAQQGRYFKWSMPPGWRVSETNAGVTLTSPDGKYSASLAAIMRSRGTITPRAFLQHVFQVVPGWRNARILSVKNLPSQHMSWQTWRFIEAKVSYTDSGLPVTGVYKVGVANYHGMNDALMVGYRSTNAEFEQAQSFMPTIAKSIVLTNGSGAFGNDTIIRPKNNPLDNSSTLQSWQNRQKGIDEAMRKDANARRGTVDLYDPSTGEKMNVWSHNKKYFWRKPGSKDVVGTDTYDSPAVGYVPLKEY